MDNDLVSVIIVHYGKKKLLMDCLNSILNQSYKTLEIIIVNNADYIIDQAMLGFLSGKVINNTRNNFYSESVNQGIRISKGRFILALNNDVILDRYFIQECVKVTKINSNIGMVSGKILDIEGKRIDSTGQFLSKYRNPLERGFKELDKGQFDKKGYIFGVCGAVAFYKRKMLEDIKLNQEYFDREYKMFYEDLDLNWRAKKLGWRAYYTPKAVAYHKRGSSTIREKSKPGFLNQFYFSCLCEELKFHVVKNRYMTIIKNEDLKSFIFNLFWKLCYELVLWSFILIQEPKLIFKILMNMTYFKIAFRKRNLPLKNPSQL